MAGMNIRRDDEVMVIAGKDKGRTGKVLRVDRAKERVYVTGLNIVKRHQRAQPGVPNAPVGVIEKEGPIHFSNVSLLDPKHGRPTRIRVIHEGGQRLRVAKRSGERID